MCPPVAISLARCLFDGNSIGCSGQGYLDLINPCDEGRGAFELLHLCGSHFNIRSELKPLYKLEALLNLSSFITSIKRLVVTKLFLLRNDFGTD